MKKKLTNLFLAMTMMIPVVTPIGSTSVPVMAKCSHQKQGGFLWMGAIDSKPIHKGRGGYRVTFENGYRCKKCKKIFIVHKTKICTSSYRSSVEAYKKLHKK